MQKQSKEELLQLLLSNDERKYNQAINYIHSSMFGLVQHMILSKGGTKEIAEDIFWEGMMEIDRWVKLKKFEPNSNVEGFLRTVCEKKWYKILERDKHLNHVELPLNLDRFLLEDDHSALLLPKKMKTILDDLMDQIGANCKEKLSLYFYRGLNHQEIADLLNLASRNVVTIAIGRCIKKLKAQVEKSGGWDLFTN